MLRDVTRFNSARKKLFEVAASGLAGAVLIICASLCVIILVGDGGPALPYFGIGHVIEKWRQSWTEDGIYTFLILVGFVGFPLGVIIGLRYPETTRKWNMLAALLAVPLFFIGGLIYAYSSHVEFPRKLKLADCSKATIVHFETPKGHYYRLKGVS